MEFDHERYGFKIEVSPSNDSEAHCRLVFRLNNLKVVDSETVEIHGWTTILGEEGLLEELKKSCEACLEEIKNAQPVS